MYICGKLTSNKYQLLTCYKVSIKEILRFDAKAVEILNIKGMVKNHHLTQAIGDLAWSSFVRKLEYKSE